jgi:Arc/MetJ family transcription regulator
MRTTLTLDDELLARARELAGIDETAALVRLALKRFIESEAARRLALLGGSDPEATLAPRRRFDAA